MECADKREAAGVRGVSARWSKVGGGGRGVSAWQGGEVRPEVNGNHRRAFSSAEVKAVNTSLPSLKPEILQ